MDNPWDRPLGVWNVAALHPDQPAIAESPNGEVLTFGELAGRAHQVVHAGRAAGLSYGDVVAVVLPNGVDMIVWMLAAGEAGWRLATLNPMAAAAEIEATIAHAGARALVVSDEYAERAGQVDTAPLLVSVGDDLPGYRRQEDLLAGHPTSLPVDRRFGMPLIYTSGTTGKPKAITREAPDIDPTDMSDAMKLFSRAFRFQPLRGAHLVSAGMYHSGCQGFFNGALNVGQALVIMKRFDPEETLRLIEKHRITTAYMVPTQFVRLLRLPDDVRDRYDLSSLESVVHSAAPCPPEVKKRMLDWWGPVIWETYGGSEGAATIAKPHHWLARPGTVGRPVRGVRVRILDDGGDELGPGRIGRVFIDVGDRQFSYRGDSAQTEQVYQGSAFTLGDIGHLDDDGFLFISDRAKDMIITGGTNVYPAEVEAVLLGHPAVADVVVVGAPDPEWGEQVRAVVQPEAGVPADDALAAELIAHCRARLASYKCPRLVEFRDALPRTETGKLAKVDIRAELWAGAERRI